MGVGGVWCGLVVGFFIYTLLLLTLDKRQGFHLQERYIANGNADFVS